MTRTLLIPRVSTWQIPLCRTPYGAITILLLLFSGISGFGQTAQTANPLRFGIFGRFILPVSSGSISGVPSVPSCAPSLSADGGSGFDVGGIAQVPLSPGFGLRLGLGFTRMTSTLRTEETIGNTVDVRGGTASAVVEHRLDAKSSTIGAEAAIAWAPFSFPLWLRLGLSGDYTVGARYDQVETLTAPSNATFTNGLATRNQSSGALTDASSFGVTAQAGVSYDIAVGAGLILSPEIVWRQALTPAIRDSAWNIHSLRLGASITMSIITAPEKITEPLASTPQAQPPASLAPPVAAVLASAINDDGSETPILRVSVEEFLSTQVRPMLNYIFFEEGAAQLPARYEMLSPTESGSFDPGSLRRRDLLGTYHNILNIIGRRMRENPSSTLRLVGCGPDGGDDENAKAGLGALRAATVREYLRDTWGIEESRLRMESRAMPDKLSNVNDPDGLAENRRVEMYASPTSLLDPLVIGDTIRTATPPGVRFRTDASAQAGLSRWKLVASQKGVRLKEFAGSGSPPAVIDWKLAEDAASIPTMPAPLEYRLEVTDADGQTTTTTISSIPMEQVTISRKRTERSGDRELDKYGLILFDFGSAELNEANRRITGSIRGRISPGARVSITGFTDRVGDPEVNRSLSQERARATASALGTPDARVDGVGESRLLFDNDFPEGRFYSRIVTVDVDNPVRR